MPTKKKKKGTKSAEAAKLQGYAAAVPSQVEAAEAQGQAPTLTSAQNAGADVGVEVAAEEEAAPPAVPSRSSKPSTTNSTAIAVDAFEIHVRGLRDHGAVASLFNQVQVDAQENPGTFENAMNPDNKTKNRYVHIVTPRHLSFMPLTRRTLCILNLREKPCDGVVRPLVLSC